MSAESSRFLKGAVVLTIAGAIVKILGAIYRIPLYSILGPEGMGLFQAAYPLYSMMLAVSIAGVPVAVSKLVAENIARKNYLGAHQVFKVSLLLMSITGATVTLVLMLGARHYAENYLQAPGVFYPLIAISPAVFFFAVKSAFRGFFQGQQKMMPTGFSQVMEQLIRVLTLFVLASTLVGVSLEYGAAGAAFGSVTGAATALLVLAGMYWRQRKDFFTLAATGNNKLEPFGRVLRNIMWLALPLTISSIVVPLINAVDSTIIIPRLQVAGFAETRALELFGNLTGAAMPLVGLPTIITMAIAVSLIPAISNADAVGNKALVAKLSSLASRIGMIIGLPATVGLFLLAQPISVVLFNNAEVALPLQWASLAIIFLTLQKTTTPVLQGLGKTYLPVLHTFIGLLFKVSLNYTLTAMPGVNILGPVIGTITFFVIASGLNFAAVYRLVGWQDSFWQALGRPLVNACLMGAAVYGTYPLAQSAAALAVQSLRGQATIGLAVAIIVGVAVYGLASFFSGVVTTRELEMIPRVGKKIAAFMNKLGLRRK